MQKSFNASSFINLKGLLYASLPLALSFATKHIMIIADRIILSYYSIDAMNVASFAGIAVHWLSGPFGAFASAAIILVGKYNGAQEYHKVGVPVWQMIFLSFASNILYIAATFGLDFFSFPDFFTQHMMYVKLLMLFGFLDPLISALASFYIGIGERFTVAISYVISNLVNIILAIMLVFGIKGFVPQLGSSGAAIATIIAESTQALILFGVFLSKKYRKQYHTNLYSFDKKIFMECISLGFASAILPYFEMTAFLATSYINTLMGVAHATIYNISFYIYLIFSCFIGAIERSSVSFASNLIGGKEFTLFPKLVRSCISLTCLSCLVLLVPLVLFPDTFLSWFQFQNFQQEGFMNILSKDILVGTCRYLWAYFLFRCISVIIRGILFALNDLKFSIYATGVTIIFTLIAPMVYYFVFLKPYFTPCTTWQILSVYALVSVIIFYIRYVFVFKQIEQKWFTK